MTTEEAQAVVRLWSQRQWERQQGPAISDVAEALEIPMEEAALLLADVRGTSPARSFRAAAPFRNKQKTRLRLGGLCRLTATVFGLTGLFSFALERLLG